MTILISLSNLNHFSYFYTFYPTHNIVFHKNFPLSYNFHYSKRVLIQFEIQKLINNFCFIINQVIINHVKIFFSFNGYNSIDCLKHFTKPESINQI